MKIKNLGRGMLKTLDGSCCAFSGLFLIKTSPQLTFQRQSYHSLYYTSKFGLVGNDVYFGVKKLHIG